MKKAFTLIELLVVIAIIGILSTVVIASLNSARAKARDARRLSDIRTIQTALEMYYADNGSYPSTAGGCTGGGTIPNSSFCNSVESLSGGYWIVGGALSPYLPKDPTDPTPVSANTAWAGTAGAYFYNSHNIAGCVPGQFYRLWVPMETSQYNTGTVQETLCDGTSVFTRPGGVLIVKKN